MRLSAERGVARAVDVMGYYYETGMGVQRNDNEALKWYQRAANQQSSYGMFNVGEFYKEGRGGLEKDYAKAMTWYRKSADLDDAMAMTAIGEMYQDGLGVGVDGDRAVKWYLKGAEAGNRPRRFTCWGEPMMRAWAWQKIMRRHGMVSQGRRSE